MKHTLRSIAMSIIFPLVVPVYAQEPMKEVNNICENQILHADAKDPQAVLDWMQCVSENEGTILNSQLTQLVASKMNLIPSEEINTTVENKINADCCLKLNSTRKEEKAKQ